MSAIVAFSSITGTVAPISGAGTGDTVIIGTTLNQPVEITLGGPNPNLNTIAVLGVSATLPPIPVTIRDGENVSIRHYGTAPTSGNIAISVIRS